MHLEWKTWQVEMKQGRKNMYFFTFYMSWLIKAWLEKKSMFLKVSCTVHIPFSRKGVFGLFCWVFFRIWDNESKVDNQK